MAKIKELIKELDIQLNKEYEEYVALHDELNKHRGKPIDDTNLPEVNRILKEIQDKFQDIYPAYSYIGQRYEYSVNVVNEYNKFIDTLKTAGAAPAKEKDTPQ